MNEERKQSLKRVQVNPEIVNYYSNNEINRFVLSRPEKRGHKKVA